MRWRRPLRGALALALLLSVIESCGGRRASSKPSAVFWEHSPPRCARDEVREYYCDNLLLPGSIYMSPEPYQDCPVSSESHLGDFEPAPPVSLFDPSYTRYARQRLPPGNQCCYSWCNRLTVAAPNPRSAWDACRTPAAFRESYCVEEPESGTSSPSAAPYQNCPAAIEPPAKSVFAAPASALFDDRLTRDRRREGALHCCYSWCSQAPPTSGMEGR